MSKLSPRYGIVAVLAPALLVLAACSSPSETTAQSDGSSPTAAASGDAQKDLQAAYKGNMGTPPTTSIVPPKNVNVWVVSCGEQVPSCSVPTAATVQAAKAIGWTAKTCDGQLNPDGWGSCVRQAVSAGAKVIIPTGIDCASIQQPFAQAKKAGVIVIGGGGADCNAVGGPKLWASERLSLANLDAEQNYNLQGKLAADWIIGKTNGKAKVLNLDFTDAIWGPWLTKGFTDAIAACTGCSIVRTLKFSNNDIANGTLSQKFSTALLQAAAANAVYIPVGGLMNAGLAQAVISSGRSAALNVITGLGTTANFDLIRANGGQDALVGYPFEWGGWGSVDTAIRVLSGKTALVQGDGYQVVDSTNLPPKGQSFTGGVDFRAKYRAAWGV